MIQKEFRNEDPTGKVIALMLLVVSLMGAMPLSVSIGLKGIPPLKMACLRSILGIVVVGGVGVYYGMSLRLRFNELPRLLLVAALHALHIITLNIGGLFTTASRSTIFFSLYPLFVILFGHFFVPNDKLSITKILGILAAFCGVCIAIAPDLQGSGATDYLIGNVIVILSACCLGLRIIITKVFVQEIYPHRLLVWLLGINTPFFYILSLIFESDTPIQWTIASCAGLLYQGCIATGFCFLVLTWVLRKYKASNLVVFSFLMPISGVLFSHILLGEELTFSLLMGTGFAAMGIYLVNRNR